MSHAATAAPKARSDAASSRGGYLRALGAYGFDEQEVPILAALVTGDPLLLIGRCGTGKTFLLNSISEALGLEHRHYNASLISFDDLVGFPYPDEARESVRFLETPATVWGAQSVLIDEISRCKPEHQNRLFSLIHERKVQGLPLTKLRYRWAAMNPGASGESAGEEYLGAEPLDPALADRFAVIIEVNDWGKLREADRQRIADPAGEGAPVDDGGALARQLATWQASFAAHIGRCPTPFTGYACAVTTALGDAGIRISPRRARLIARTLLAAHIVHGGIGAALSNRLFLQVLRASLPQRAWGEQPAEAAIAAAHRLAWDSAALDGKERWIHLFHLERDLARKAELLLHKCPDPDTGTLAVEQMLARESPVRVATFALAAYPAAVAGRLAIGAEALQDLGRLAQELFTVEGEISWREPAKTPSQFPPHIASCAKLLEDLPPARSARARQLFDYARLRNLEIRDPTRLEAELDRCVRVFADGDSA